MDPRNWIRGEAAFTTLIGMCVVLPDETDLLELGVRPAMVYVEDAIAPLDCDSTLIYRRVR